MPKFGVQNSEEKTKFILYIVCNSFLEFVAVKFNICSTFYLVYMN